MAKRSEVETSTSNEANRLLASLPNIELASLEPHLQHVQFKLRQLLQEAEERIEYLYFPRSGVVSAVKEFLNGDVIEVATMGNEGVVGHSVGRYRRRCPLVPTDDVHSYRRMTSSVA